MTKKLASLASFVVLITLTLSCRADEASGPPIKPSFTDVKARNNTEFLSSLGVGTHVDQGYDSQAYLRPLLYLGVRNIRDGARNLHNSIMLFRQAGVHIDLIGGDVTNLIHAAQILARLGALLSVEGPNEPNNFQIKYEGQTGGGAASWVPVAHLQRDIYQAVHSDPNLNSYPVFHVSEGGAETENVGMQFLTIPKGAGTSIAEGTTYADFANVHNYVSGHSRYGDNQAWQAADPVLNSQWDGLYVEYGRTWARGYPGNSIDALQSLPRVTTETGWDAATPADERVQGVVLVNTFLAQFKRGWRYTFIYELGEGEGGGGHQGLFHTDWTPKMSATYIHNLTTILADHAADAVPGTLAFAVPNEPHTVHDLLLQKGPGVFDLVIWGEQVTGVNQVRVEFPKPPKRVDIYDVTSGVAPIRSVADVAAISLPLGDHALILEIR